MIRIILPPRHRGPDCPYVQRTESVIRMLQMLNEEHEVYTADDTFRTDKGDIVFYTYCLGAQVVRAGTIPVECGVGYDLTPWGAYRVYESEAWRHYNFGKYNVPLHHRRNSWVIPWAFDHDKWPLGDGSGGYVSYLGRTMSDKGMQALSECCAALPNVLFRLASTEFYCGPTFPNLEIVGPLYGEARAEFLGKAVAHLCPTEYVEPLGGSAIEAMLCGTPVISSNYGGFTESVVNLLSGLRCKSSKQMIAAFDEVYKIPRESVRHQALLRYSIQLIVNKWREALPEIKLLGTSTKE